MEQCEFTSDQLNKNIFLLGDRHDLVNNNNVTPKQHNKNKSELSLCNLPDESSNSESKSNTSSELNSDYYSDDLVESSNIDSSYSSNESILDYSSYTSSESSFKTDAKLYEHKINNIIQKIDAAKLNMGTLNTDNDIDKNDLYLQILSYITDIDWKTNLSIEEIDIYQPLYNQICNQIASIPKIVDILQLSMPYDEKCELFEKLLLLNNIGPITLEFFDLKKYINKTIKNYNAFSITDKEYKYYKTIENSLSLIEEKPKPIEYQILDLDISDYNKSYIYSRYKYLLESETANILSSNKLKKWIESIINIPTKIKPMLVISSDSNYEKNKYLWTVKNLLDKEVYGLTEVKEKILFLLNNRITNQNSKGLNFALCGPPGVAKTSIINVLSKSIDLPFFQINAAGMKDSSFLLGHNYTYEGSSPGVIVQGLSAMKYKNGIIYFDEFDKISNTEHGIEISRTLLHITDFSQNNKFHDRYISEQIDIDLSNIWFIYSMNNKDLIDPTLRDRISIIDIEGYDKKDKKIIANKYLLPSALLNIGLPKNSVSFTTDALDYLIDMSGDSIIGINNKSGVRQLKQLIEEILMKINFLVTTGFDTEGKINEYILDVSFNIKNFSLPVIITKKIILDLNIKNNLNNTNYINMYS